MNKRPWIATLTAHGQRLQIDLTSGPARLLTALLPYPPRSPLALRGVLEGLALWQDRILHAVCIAGDTAMDGCMPEIVDGHPYVPHSPLVDVVVQPRGPVHRLTEVRRGGGA
jgi:hypothetical protein